MTGDQPVGEQSGDERWDRALEALSARPRRRIVHALVDVPRERRVPLPDALHPASLRMDRETLRIELRHRHLPKLAAAGYVSWNGDRLTVQRGPRFPEIAAIWEQLTSSTDEYPRELVDGCPILGESV